MRRRVGTVTALGLVAAGVIAAGAAVAADPNGSPWSERNVLNVAHAGGDLEAPHSTLFAMKTAVAAGTDVLEMDLRLSADGDLMVHHDTTVDRTTNATGSMESMTTAELQALDNAYWFVPNCWSCHGLPDDEYMYRGIRTGERPPPDGFSPSDFTIPTLEEVAEAFPNRVLDVEIKDGPRGMDAAEALADFIAEHGPSDRYLVASFDDAILAHFKSFAPDVATSPGLGEMTSWFATRGPLPGHTVLQVPPTYTGIEVVSQQFVDDAHANGLAVWVWFNGNEDDSPATWQKLIDFGVDALLTGKPAAAQAAIDANDAAFRVAPQLGSTGLVRGLTAHVEASCPVLHVSTCEARVVALAFDRRGRIGIVGDTTFSAARATSTEVTMTMSTFGRRLMESNAVPIYALVLGANPDTANTLAVVELSRR